MQECVSLALGKSQIWIGKNEHILNAFLIPVNTVFFLFAENQLDQQTMPFKMWVQLDLHWKISQTEFCAWHNDFLTDVFVQLSARSLPTRGGGTWRGGGVSKTWKIWSLQVHGFILQMK